MSTSVVNNANKFITITSRPSSFTPVSNNVLTHYKNLSTNTFSPLEQNISYFIQYYIVYNGKFVSRVVEPFILYPKITIKRLDFRLVSKIISVPSQNFNTFKIMFDNLKYNIPIYNYSVLTCVLTVRYFETSNIYDMIDIVPRRTYTIRDRDFQTTNYIGWLVLDNRVLGKYMEYEISLSHSGTVFQTYLSSRIKIPDSIIYLEKQFYPMQTYDTFINKDNYRLMFRVDASEESCYVLNSNQITNLTDVSGHLITNNTATLIGREPLNAFKLPTRQMAFENLTNTNKKCFRGIASFGRRQYYPTGGNLVDNDILKYNYVLSPSTIENNRFTKVFVFELPTTNGFSLWTPLTTYYQSNGIQGLFMGNVGGKIKSGAFGVIPDYGLSFQTNTPYIMVCRAECISPPSGSPVSATYRVKTDIVRISDGVIFITNEKTETNIQSSLYNSKGGFLGIGIDEITTFSPDIRWSEVLLYNQWIQDGYLEDLVSILRSKWS